MGSTTDAMSSGEFSDMEKPQKQNILQQIQGGQGQVKVQGQGGSTLQQDKQERMRAMHQKFGKIGKDGFPK